MLLTSAFLSFECYAGLVGCLTWNVIAVTAAWIKGEGAIEEFSILPIIIRLLLLILTEASFFVFQA